MSSKRGCLRRVRSSVNQLFARRQAALRSEFDDHPPLWRGFSARTLARTRLCEVPARRTGSTPRTSASYLVEDPPGRPQALRVTDTQQTTLRATPATIPS